MCSAALVVGAIWRSANLVLGGPLHRPSRRSRLFAPILGQVLPLAIQALGDLWRSVIFGALALWCFGALALGVFSASLPISLSACIVPCLHPIPHYISQVDVDWPGLGR
jgi:hypothetical protein